MLYTNTVTVSWSSVTTVVAAALAMVATSVSAASVDGGQQFGSFSGENARERMSFGRRPIVLSRWLDYSKVKYCFFLL